MTPIPARLSHFADALAEDNQAYPEKLKEIASIGSLPGNQYQAITDKLVISCATEGATDPELYHLLFAA